MAPMVFLAWDHPQKQQGPIIKAKTYATLLECEQLLKQTNQEAERILARAHTKAESLKKAAREEAERQAALAKAAIISERKRGLALGLQAGKREAASNLLSVVTHTARYLHEFEDRLAATVMVALKKVLGQMDIDELTMRLIRNVLDSVRNQSRVLVRVAPSQLNVIQGRIKQIISPLGVPAFVDVVADMRLQAGDCILEHETGIIEAGLQTQITAIQAAVAQSLNRDPSRVKDQLSQIEGVLLRDLKQKLGADHALVSTVAS